MAEAGIDGGDEHVKWRPSKLIFPFGCLGIDANGNDIVGPVNLMEYIGKDCPRPKELLWIARRDDWNNAEPASRQALNAEMMRVCHAAGFNVSSMGWSPRQCRNPYGCCRSVVHSKRITAQSPSKQRHTKTRRPRSRDEKCTFRFHVSWSNATPSTASTLDSRAHVGRWILVGSGGCAEHRGHAPEAPKNLFVPTKMLAAEQCQQLIATLDSSRATHVPSLNGLNLTARQVMYLSQKHKRPRQSDSPSATTAQTRQTAHPVAENTQDDWGDADDGPTFGEDSDSGPTDTCTITSPNRNNAYSETRPWLPHEIRDQSQAALNELCHMVQSHPDQSAELCRLLQNGLHDVRIKMVHTLAQNRTSRS